LLLPEQDENRRKRPELLTVLCILTFIGSGFSLMANLVALLTRDTWQSAMESGALDMLTGTIEMDALDLLFHVHPAYYLFQALFFAMSLGGALLMWNLNKIGFHLYAVGQISLLIIGKVFIPSLPFPLIPLLLATTFVLLYARNLRYMT
jgi:hypothetical protein